MKQGTPSRKDFVGIGLMPHIPDDAIVWAVEHEMECQGELNHPQARSQMPAVHGERPDDDLTNFLGQLLELRQGQLLEL